MSKPYLVAAVGDQWIAFDAVQIEAIMKVGAIQPVPRAPAHVAGLCAVRSTVMTVIDIAKAASGSAHQPGEHAVIVQHDGHRYALRVDRIADVEPVDEAACPCDSSIGSHWFALAPSHIATSRGAALVLDIGRVIVGTGQGH